MPSIGKKVEVKPKQAFFSSEVKEHPTPVSVDTIESNEQDEGEEDDAEAELNMEEYLKTLEKSADN